MDIIYRSLRYTIQEGLVKSVLQITFRNKALILGVYIYLLGKFQHFESNYGIYLNCQQTFYWVMGVTFIDAFY